MTNRLLLKRSSSPGSVPGAASLEYGELALNYQDGNLFYKNASNTVTVIASNQFLSVVGNITGGNVSVTGNANSGNVFTTNITLSGTGTAVNASSGNILTNQITGTQLNLLAGAYTVGINGSGVAANYTLNLPANAGSNGQVLTTNGSGGLSWSSTADAFETIVVPGQSNIVANATGVLNIQATGSTNGTTLTTDPATGTLTISSTTGDLIFQNGDPLQLGSVSGPATAKNDLGLVTGLTEDTYDLGNFFYTGAWIDNTWIYANSITGNKINDQTDIITSGNITATYFFGNGSFLSGIDTTLISNGNSNVKVVSSGGNVTVGINGTANVAIFSTNGLAINGNISGNNLATPGSASITGNVTAGNVTASGNVGGTYLLGNGAFITGITAFDAFDEIVVPGQANIVANASGILNIQATGSTNGTTLTTDPSTGTLNISSSTGDLIFQNGDPLKMGLVTGAVLGRDDLGLISVSATDRYDLGDFFYSGAWIDNTWIYANSITGNKINSATDISTTGNITGGNLNAAGLSLSGNVVSALNMTTGITTTGNITGGYFIGDGSLLTGIVNPAFQNIQVALQPTVTANSSGNLTFEGAGGLVIITDPVTDTITFVQAVNPFLAGGDLGLITVLASSFYDFGGIIDPVDVAYDLGFVATTGPVYPNEFKLPNYVVSGLPLANQIPAGCMVFVSNAAGGSIPAFSDGANWRRVDDRTIVS